MNNETGKQTAQLTKKKPNSPRASDPWFTIRVKYIVNEARIAPLQTKFHHFTDVLILLLIALSDIAVTDRRGRINGHIGNIFCPYILSQIPGVVAAAPWPCADSPW